MIETGQILMRFNDYNVDIDKDLIAALNSGTLVVFVGAGVSAKAYPNQLRNTYYPTFKELVSSIATNIDKQLSDTEEEMLKQGLSDRVLGEWKRDGHDVHGIAAEILSKNETKQKIDLHRAIIRLFPEESEPRIVTTNFDNLLIRACDKEGLKDNSGWKIYEAPSLPPANTERFKGICFLHGRVTEPQEMILTDRDIGRAYMDEGWALKFSHELFRNFNVLFIGYGLDDPPLRYLSLALEGNNDKKHWVILADKKKKEERDWLRRGVTPTWYPAKRNDFRALERTISDWAENNRFGYIDRRNLLSGWGQTDPNQLAPHDLDCAKYYLQTPELLRDFAENIKNENNWFDKLVEWGHFDFILKKSAEFKEADNVLAQVLIKWLLQDPHKWLVKLLPYKRTMNETLFEILCRELERGSEQYNLKIDNLRMLLEFFKYLIENDSNKSFSLWIGKILKRLVKEGFPDDAVWLFIATNRTDPDIRAVNNFSYLMAKETGEETKGIYPFELEMEFNSQDSRVYRSRKYIDKIFLPEVKIIGSSLLYALTNELFYIRMSLKRMGGGKYSYLRRKAIEQHAQNIHRSDMYNFFIDTIIDLWEALLKEAPDQAIKIYHCWSEIDDAIFNRMALYAARLILRIVMLSKENILGFLLKQDKLWQSETKHEAMRLLKSLYEYSPEHRERLVDYVLSGPPLSRGKDSEDDKRYTEQKVFRMLEYLKKHGLELTKRGEKYLGEINEKHPKWELGSDADIENPVYSGRHKNPFTIEEIHSKAPKEVALMLRDYKGTWERERGDFCNTVGAVCRQYSEWCLELFDHLNDILTELPEDTINHIIWGLRSTNEKEKVAWNLEQVNRLVNIFQKMVEKRPVAKFWTSLPGFLQHWQKTHKVEFDIFAYLLNRLASIFKSFDYEREKKGGPVEWIQRAANHSYGDLTELYLAYAQQRVTEQKKAEINYDIGPEIINFFEFTIDNYDYGTRYGLCVLGRWLSWFEAIVPDWTKKKLVPAFNWATNKEMALIAWSGYLWNSTLSRYLSKLFDDYFLDAAQHYKEFGKEEQKGLTTHVAALIWFKDIEISDLKKFTLLIDREGRINILAMWQLHLDRAEKPIAKSFWNTTIIPYWDWCERQRYLTLPDGNTERFRFWELIPYSYQVVTKAVKRAVKLAPSVLDSGYPFYEELLKTDFSALYPEEFTCLLLAFIQTDQNPRWHQEEWKKLWDSVKNSGTKKLGKLKDELAREGVI